MSNTADDGVDVRRARDMACFDRQLPQVRELLRNAPDNVCISSKVSPRVAKMMITQTRDIRRRLEASKAEQNQ